MHDEEWAPIEGHPNYAVSSYGRVYSAERRMKKRPHYRSYLHRGRYLKNIKSPLGYLFVRLDSKGCQVHRLVALAFLGPPPEGHECDHVDRDPSNCHLENLRWLPIAENRAQSRRLGAESSWHKSTRIKGKSPKPGLTVEQAQWVLRSNLGTKALADCLGVTQRSIQRIRQGVHWGHLR